MLKRTEKILEKIRGHAYALDVSLEGPEFDDAKDEMLDLIHRLEVSMVGLSCALITQGLDYRIGRNLSKLSPKSRSQLSDSLLRMSKQLERTET